MCAYKICYVEFKYWGMQTKIEKFIHETGLWQIVVDIDIQMIIKKHCLIFLSLIILLLNSSSRRRIKQSKKYMD